MRHSSIFFFYTRTGFASQSGWRISLINPAVISFVISFLIPAVLSGENCHNRCFTGLEPSLISILCSANSLGTPGMSAGFQAKMSLLSQRKLVSTSSYFADRWALIVAVFVRSPVPRSICLTLTSFGGARMLGFLAGIASSSGLISAATVAISFLPSMSYAFAVIWIA